MTTAGNDPIISRHKIPHSLPAWTPYGAPIMGILERKLLSFNLLWSNDALLHRKGWPSVVQEMAFGLFGAKPSPKPMGTYSQMSSLKQLQWNFNWNSNFLTQGNMWNVVCKIVSHFIPALKCLQDSTAHMGFLTLLWFSKITVIL